MKLKKQLSTTQINLLVDGIIFIAFLIIMAPHFTGIALHEWLSIAFGVTIVTHLLLHWAWIVTTTQRLFAHLPRQTRLNHTLNLLLFIDMTLVIFTGFMISESALPALGIKLAQSGLWHMLHTTTANIALGLVGLHVGLHWQWLVNSFNQYVLKPLFGKAQGRESVPGANSMQKGV